MASEVSPIDHTMYVRCKLLEEENYWLHQRHQASGGVLLYAREIVAAGTDGNVSGLMARLGDLVRTTIEYEKADAEWRKHNLEEYKKKRGGGD